MKQQKQPSTVRRLGTLRWRLTLFVFLIIALSGMLTGVVLFLSYLWLRRVPVVDTILFNPFFLTLTLLIICALSGALITGFLGRYYLRPLKRVIAATKEVRRGNFATQVDTKDPTTSEMGQMIDSFNEMVLELGGIELLRKDFINNFSHEFKTPIISIRGFARELQQDTLSPEQRKEYAKIIAEEADRLAKLSIHVLELSKLENQRIVTEKTEFYLDEQLRQCILLQENDWTAKNIEIIPELEEVLFYSNEEILSHVWTNLIHNAIKFTPENGSIRITLRADEKSVTVTVSDTGIGMTEEVREHIFEKFYQGDTSRHRVGYGIGLTMAHRATTLCGGTITVESAPGAGSTFTVTLPR